jgi:predicted RNA binding protein YcfA (HicA-like mRNA interferase family)
VKVRDVIRMLEQDGWSLARTRGSHRQYKHPAKLGVVTVTGKPGDELAPGTLNNVSEAGGTETMKKYLIVIEPTQTGFSAYLPDLPGCVSTG